VGQSSGSFSKQRAASTGGIYGGKRQNTRESGKERKTFGSVRQMRPRRAEILRRSGFDKELTVVVLQKIPRKKRKLAIRQKRRQEKVSSGREDIGKKEGLSKKPLNACRYHAKRKGKKVGGRARSK